jgi:hypothetical protein
MATFSERRYRFLRRITPKPINSTRTASETAAM